MNIPLQLDTPHERAARRFAEFAGHSTADYIRREYVAFAKAAGMLGLTEDELLARMQARQFYIAPDIVTPATPGTLEPTGEPRRLLFPRHVVVNQARLEARERLAAADTPANETA